MKFAPLSDITVQLESGSRPKGGVTSTGDIPSLGAEHLSDTGHIRLDSPKRIPRTFYEAMPSGRVRVNDILIVKDGATTGKTCLVRPDAMFLPAAINEHVFRVEIDSGRADARYVYHYLRSPAGQSAIMSDFRGSTVGGISRNFVTRVQVPLPRLEEQRRIADILDHAAALQFCRQLALHDLHGLEEAVFHDLFDDVKDVATVAELAAPGKGTIRTGPFGSQLLHSEFVASGVAVLGLDNVVSNSFRWPEQRFITMSKYETLTRYSVFPGDVLISIMGTTGRCVVVPEGIGTVINTKHLCAITPDRSRILPEVLRASFLWHPVSRAHLLRQTKGSIMDGLNMGIIKETPMPVPPLEVQNKFLERLTVLRDQIDAMQSETARLNELSSTLQARAFQGSL